MGLFSRKESTSRTSRTSSDEQLVELRNKARRRLIGAVVLVLAAIIVVPVLLTDNGIQEPDQVVSVIPSIIPPSEEQYRLSENLEPVTAGDNIDNTEDPGLIESPLTAPPSPNQTEQNSSAASPPQIAAAEPKPEPKPDPKPTPAPRPDPKPAVKAEPKQPVARTDDGAIALALLEGRTPPSKPVTSSGGDVVVQIGAYSSRADADSRRSKLVSSGVSNAYVESVTVSGKPAFRLRVGPFPSRQAAQAAQARLRSLGYENSFISSK